MTVVNKSNQRKNDREKVYINWAIKAFNILILWENWEQLGTFPRKEALEKAREEWLDLVQVWYNWKDKVSVCKIIDYWKYQYSLKKKEKDKKKTQKSKGIKEIKISYWIDENYLNMKIEKAKDFLSKWYNVRFTIKLKWRENIFKEQSREKMVRIADSLSDYAKNWWIREEGRWFSLILFAKLK
jgi:translation initiation factor IF-3